MSGDDRRLDLRPGMGMWWEITRSTADTPGELFEATNWIEPRPAQRFESFFRDMHRLIHEVFQALALVGRALRFEV